MAEDPCSGEGCTFCSPPSLAEHNSRKRRRPFRKASKRRDKNGGKVDRSCRNHGSCSWCRDGRQHSRKRQEPLEEA